MCYNSKMSKETKKTIAFTEFELQYIRSVIEAYIEKIIVNNPTKKNGLTQELLLAKKLEKILSKQK